MLISSLSGVHSTLEKNESVAYWLIVHTSLSCKRSFWKTPFKPEKFEIAGLCFCMDEKHLKKDLFENDDKPYDNHVNSLPETGRKAFELNLSLV